nr:phospholipase-like protein [Tanacetum cinerariifolium]
MAHYTLSYMIPVAQPTATRPQDTRSAASTFLGREGDITFRDRVFPEKIREYLKNIGLLSLIEDEYRFNSFSDRDSIRVKKPNCDLYPNKCEAQSEWFKRSTNFFKMYTPRAPPVEYGGLFGAYLKKVPFAHTRRKKDGDAESGFQTSSKEVSLKDRVKAIESLCTSLMILPKEITSLKARVYKLETIINVITKKKLNLKRKMLNFGYLGDKYWSDKDDALDDLVDETGVVEVEKDLSEDDGLKVQKLEAENKRDVERVFIPINEPKRHWSLAQFHIQSGNVTFYDSQKIEGVEYRSWLARGIPLEVKDPIQMALAYREKMVKFYFEHKIICPS